MNLRLTATPSETTMCVSELAAGEVFVLLGEPGTYHGPYIRLRGGHSVDTNAAELITLDDAALAVVVQVGGIFEEPPGLRRVSRPTFTDSASVARTDVPPASVSVAAESTPTPASGDSTVPSAPSSGARPPEAGVSTQSAEHEKSTAPASAAILGTSDSAEGMPYASSLGVDPTGADTPTGEQDEAGTPAQPAPSPASMAVAGEATGGSETATVPTPGDDRDDEEEPASGRGDGTVYADWEPRRPYQREQTERLRLAYGAILKHADGRARIDLTTPDLAELLGVSAKGVGRPIRAMRDRGALEYEANAGVWALSLIATTAAHEPPEEDSEDEVVERLVSESGGRYMAYHHEWAELLGRAHARGMLGALRSIGIRRGFDVRPSSSGQIIMTDPAQFPEVANLPPAPKPSPGPKPRTPMGRRRR